jgi:hypothetical protein
VDPNGNSFLLILTISVIMSLAFEFGEDILEDGVIDHTLNEYAGALVSGAISSLGGGVVSTLALGVLAGYADAWICGTLNSENALMIGVSSLISTGIGLGIGSIARKISTNIKANKIINMKGIVDNNVINQTLRPIGNSLNIGANRATSKNISEAIFRANSWSTGHYIESLFSAFGDVFDLQEMIQKYA